jgi:hypothetical protein
MKASKELKEIAEKDPMEMTKEDISKLAERVSELYDRNASKPPSHNLNEFFESKKDEPEGFIETVKFYVELALGKYEPDKKELKKIEHKIWTNPMEITKKELMEIEKAETYNYGSSFAYLINLGYVADGELLLKKECPELFIDSIKVTTKLALGEYTPGRGVFKRKYAKPFPSR